MSHTDRCVGGPISALVVVDVMVQLAADDEQRRRIRRERNKLAAARCRQRRVDLTNELLTVS